MISTHTPLAGRDLSRMVETEEQIKFLLTRPLRDVTTVVLACAWAVEFLLTRPLRDVTATFCMYVAEHPHILERTCFYQHHLHDIVHIPQLL